MNRTQMESAVESARANRIDLVASIRSAYYNVLLAEQSLVVLKEAIETTQQVVDNTRNLYENGLAAEYDYITAQVQLSNLKPQVLQAENAIEITKLQLKMSLSLRMSISRSRVALTASARRCSWVRITLWISRRTPLFAPWTSSVSCSNTRRNLSKQHVCL